VHQRILPIEQSGGAESEPFVRIRHLRIADECKQGNKVGEAEKHYRLWMGIDAQSLPEVRASSLDSQETEFVARRPFKDAGLSELLEEYGARAEVLSAVYGHQQDLRKGAKIDRDRVTMYSTRIFLTTNSIALRTRPQSNSDKPLLIDSKCSRTWPRRTDEHLTLRVI